MPMTLSFIESSFLSKKKVRRQGQFCITWVIKGCCVCLAYGLFCFLPRIWLPFLLLSGDKMLAWGPLCNPVKVKVIQSCPNSLQPHGLYSPWNSPGKNISEQPIPSPADLPDPESNEGILHCRQILYQLSYQGTLLPKARNKYLFQNHLGEATQGGEAKQLLELSCDLVNGGPGQWPVIMGQWSPDLELDTIEGHQRKCKLRPLQESMSSLKK